MHNRILRRILGTLAGLIAAFVTIWLIELAEAQFYPTPEIDPSDAAALATFITAVPLGAKLIVVAGWIAGPLIGTLVALRIDHWDTSAFVITGLGIAGGAINVLSIPHPAWMQVMAVVAPVIGGTIGLGLSRKLLARRYARGRVHGAAGPAEL